MLRPARRGGAGGAGRGAPAGDRQAHGVEQDAGERLPAPRRAAARARQHRAHAHREQVARVQRAEHLRGT